MKDFFELREGKATKTEDKGQFIYAAKQAKAKGDSTFVFAGKTYNCEEVLESETTYKPDPDGGNHKAVKAAETRAKIAKHDAEARKSMDEAVNMGPWNRGAINKAMAKAGIKGKMAKDFIAVLRKSGTVDEELEESTETLSENYRTLARAGMGTESKGEARVGLELDYYDSSGSKRMGKITKVSSKGYMVKDDKDGKVRQFSFHDRAKAKEILARLGKGKYNESVELDEVSDDLLMRASDKAKNQAHRAQKSASDALKRRDKKSYVKQMRKSDHKKTQSKYFATQAAKRTHDRLRKESVDLEEAVAKVKTTTPDKVASGAKRFGLKADTKGGHVSISGPKGKLNDFMMAIIGRSSYGNASDVTESVELSETPDLEKMSKELLKHKNKGVDYEKAAAYVRAMFMNSSLTVQDKAMKGLLDLLKKMDLDDRTTITKILKDNGFKVRGGSLVR